MTPETMRQCSNIFSEAASWPGLWKYLGTIPRTLRRWSAGEVPIPKRVTDEEVAKALTARAMQLYKQALLCKTAATALTKQKERA